MGRLKIYVSGPISNGGTAPADVRLANVGKAIAATLQLIDAGYAPLCPQLTEYVEIEGGRRLPHEVWMAVDLPWVSAADAVFRLSGASRGADRECEEARRLGIPVFHGMDGLSRWAKGRDIPVYDSDWLGRQPVQSHSSFKPEQRAEESILIEAHRLTHGDRNAAYGCALDDYQRTTDAFEALTGIHITPEQGMLFMVCVKLSREAHKHRTDNLVDACGYLSLIEDSIQERLKRRQIKIEEIGS